MINKKHTQGWGYGTRDLASLLITLTICGLFLFVTSSGAQAAELRRHVTLTAADFRLSDIFDGISTSNDTVMGISPKPGQSMTLNARTLIRVARTYGVDWRPDHVADRITLDRAATRINQTMINDVVMEALGAQGFDSSIRVNYSTPLRDMFISADHAPVVEISHISVVPGRNWFEAVIASPSALRPEKTMRIYGTIEKMVSIPMLAQPVRAGDVISARDIIWKDYPSNRIGGAFLLDAEDIIGMEPRQMIRADEPVMTMQLQKPQMIKRGEKITIMYETGSLSLSARGKALEGGSQGDYIRVVNQSSHRTIEVRVEDFKVAKAEF